MLLLNSYSVETAFIWLVNLFGLNVAGFYSTSSKHDFESVAVESFSFSFSCYPLMCTIFPNPNTCLKSNLLMKRFSSSSAECHSGDGAWETYKKDGPSRQCFTSKYEPCDFECEAEPCAGTDHTMFVYKIGPREFIQSARCVLFIATLCPQLLQYIKSPNLLQANSIRITFYIKSTFRKMWQWLIWIEGKNTIFSENIM